MSVDTTLESIVRRDRLVVITALTVVIALSWAYLLAGASMVMTTASGRKRTVILLVFG